MPKVEDTAIHLTDKLSHSLQLTEGSVPEDTPYTDVRIGRDADLPAYRGAARTD